MPSKEWIAERLADYKACRSHREIAAIESMLAEYAREQVEAARKAFPESAWEAIFAEHERDHQHADASRLGCNGCAMLAYTESLRGQLQTLRGERDCRHYVCEAHVPLAEPGNHDDTCPCCEAMHQADLVAAITQEKAALEARVRDADRLADEVAVLVKRQTIDARSPAGDALLDYREPPSTPRADRLVELEARERALREALEATNKALVKMKHIVHHRTIDDCEALATLIGEHFRAALTREKIAEALYNVPDRHSDACASHELGKYCDCVMFVDYSAMVDAVIALLDAAGKS